MCGGRIGRTARGFLPRTICDDSADVIWTSAAATADNVEPAVIDEALQLSGESLRRFEILAFFVRQASVGIARDARVGEFVERADVVGHELGTGGAVEADGEQLDVGE